MTTSLLQRVCCKESWFPILWTSVSQILYQFGLAIAAWNTVGVL